MAHVRDTEELRDSKRNATVYSNLPGYMPRNLGASLLDPRSREMIQERANIDLSALPRRNYSLRQEFGDAHYPSSDIDDKDFTFKLDLMAKMRQEQEIADEHRLIVSPAKSERVEQVEGSCSKHLEMERIQEPAGKRIEIAHTPEQVENSHDEGQATAPSKETGTRETVEAIASTPTVADRISPPTCNRCEHSSGVSMHGRGDPFLCHRCHKHYTHRQAQCSMQIGVNWIEEGDMEKDFWCFECWFVADPWERLSYETDFLAKWAVTGWERPHVGRFSVMIERRMGLGH